MVRSAATKEMRRASCVIPGISHTPSILGKLKYTVDSSRQYVFIALINTAEIQLYRSWLRPCRGHLTVEINEKNI